MNRILRLMTLASFASFSFASAAQERDAESAQRAQQRRMKDCGAEWQRAKADGRTGGKTFDQFSGECLKKKS